MPSMTRSYPSRATCASGEMVGPECRQHTGGTEGHSLSGDVHVEAARFIHVIHFP
jgi:hypothetical protein